MNTTKRSAILAIALGLAACSGATTGNAGGGSTTGVNPNAPAAGAGTKSVRITVPACTVGTAAVEYFAKLTCDGGYASPELPLAGDGAGFEATFGAVPVGKACQFAARATEHRTAPALDVHYGASLSKTFGADDLNPQVSIVLQQLDNVTTFTNTAPRIIGLTASTNTPDVFGPLMLDDVRATLLHNADSIILLNAQVQDAEGDPMWYRWDDSGLNGTFLQLDPETMQYSLWLNYNTDVWAKYGGAIPMTAWIPPLGMSGPATLTLRVQDEHTGDGTDALTVRSTSSLSATVVVDAANARTPINLAGTINHAPDILALQATLDANSTGGQVTPGQPAHVEAVIHDFDGDALNFKFLSDCTGTFKDPATGIHLSDPMSYPIPAPPLDGDNKASLAVDFYPSVAPASGTCQIKLYVDDGARGGRTFSDLTINVVPENPVAFGPDIGEVWVSSGAIGKDSKVRMKVYGQSRYGSPELTYTIELLSAVGIPTDWLPTPDYLGTFEGDTTVTSDLRGEFWWRSPADETACLQANSINNGNIYYFLVTVADLPAISNGVPAVNYAIIPVEVDCSL